MSLFGIAIGAGAGLAGIGAMVFGVGAIKRAWNYVSSGSMKEDVKAGCGHVSYLVKMMFRSLFGSFKDGFTAVISGTKWVGGKFAAFGLMLCAPLFWLYGKCTTKKADEPAPNPDAEAEEGARIAREVAEHARNKQNKS